ncbi:MAG: ATP synthase F1 subunit delta [Oscillospiraceae bacterium]|nr:ATP synthase F1 subunit delta [Oscillospiraceae bacterium]MBQ6160304.1 ATP synthase F1 subunit delta [Oscillospiraceae bacterium]
MNRAAKNYADALFEVAYEEEIDDLLLNQFSDVRRLFDENPDYVKLLYAPNIAKAERTALLDEALSGRIHPYLLNFLKLLCENGYMYDYGYCETRYRTYYNTIHGIIAGVAITAVPLKPEQMEKLRARLYQISGKTVDLINRVDPSVLGGIRLKYEGVELDGTVRQRLDGIEKTLLDAVL